MKKINQRPIYNSTTPLLTSIAHDPWLKERGWVCMNQGKQSPLFFILQASASYGPAYLCYYTKIVLVV